MSRMVFTPVSGSLFQTTRRIVTLSGTAYVMPRSWHSSTSYFSFRPTVLPQLSHGLRRWWSPANRPHLHSQLPIEYSMNSSDEFSRKSLIGKTDLKTDCRPASSRSEGSRFICRNRSYDFF